MSPSSGRLVDLRGEPLRLLGEEPRSGDLLRGEFRIPCARGGRKPLTAEVLRRGLTILSTLPNITKHACASQILDLEEHVREDFPSAHLCHVSADHPSHWAEVDHHHPNLTAPGYSLHEADPRSRDEFCAAFGVGVEGRRRIAHGLFALWGGQFLQAEIPRDQMRSPDVHPFLARLRRTLRLMAGVAASEAD